MQNEQTNPWKGLNFYKEGEVLYGRDEEIQSLSLYIINNTQTVLYGKSGIGKSSIINAGIFPIARREGLFPVAVRLSHEPDKSYIEQIKTAFAKQKIGVRALLPAIDEQHETLWEYIHRHTFFNPEDGTQVRPLLVLDQFEEIFTLQHNERRKLDFFAELADLLNEVIPQYIIDAQNKQTDEPQKTDSKQFTLDLGGSTQKKTDYETASLFNIVFVIREDFLSYLERYAKFIPVMKTNRYALMPLNEEQAAEIIIKPREGLVSLDVAKLILQKVTDRTDFQLDGKPELEVSAAVLSLYLSRLYTKKGENDEIITAGLVNQFSNDIIRDFYEQTVEKFPKEHIEIIESLLLTSDGRRDNVSKSKLLDNGIPEQEIKELADECKLLRVFSYQNDIRVEFMHDVLCKVILERQEKRALEKSNERERALKKQAHYLRIGILAGILFLCALGFSLWQGYMQVVEKHYGMVVKENGWYVGVEPISVEEASYRPYHYVLLYKGLRAKHPFAMEARNGYGKLTSDHSVTPYIFDQFRKNDDGVDSYLYEKLQTACRWEFVTNQAHDFLVQIRALNEDGEVVYVYNRSRIENTPKVICTYADESGFPLTLKEATYLYLRITYDDRGRETLVEYFDENGRPIMNKDEVYQVQRKYLSNGVQAEQYTRFWNDRLRVTRRNECGIVYSQFTEDSLRFTEARYMNDELVPYKAYWEEVTVIRYAYDEHGRCIEESYWDENNEPVISTFLHYHSIVRTYTRHGELETESYRDLDGNRVYGQVNIGKRYNMLEKRLVYDEWGNEIDRILTCEDFVFHNTHHYAEDGTLLAQDHYYVYNDAPDDTLYTYQFKHDMQARTKLVIDYDEHYAKRIAYDEAGHETRVEYYSEDNTTRMNGSGGWHINIMEYTYHDDTTYISDKCYNLANQLTYHHEIMIDSAHYTKSELKYYSDGDFHEGKRTTYESDFATVRSEESINERWETIRTYDNPQFYYRVNIVHPIKSSHANEEWGRYAENEFGDPALVYDQQEGYGYYAYNRNADESLAYYNEWGKPIDPEEEEWTILAYIETIGDLSIGFRNADIVLACNLWTMSFHSNPEEAFYNTSWEEEEDRNFIVARRNPVTNEYDTVHVFIPASLDNIDAFVYFKKCRCSAHEKNRIQYIMNTYIWKQMIVATPDQESIFRDMGIENDVLILEWNGWHYTEHSTEAFSDSMRANQPKPKHIVFWDYEADTVGLVCTEREEIGITCKTDSYKRWYQNQIDNGYIQWKNEHEPN